MYRVKNAQNMYLAKRETKPSEAYAHSNATSYKWVPKIEDSIDFGNFSDAELAIIFLMTKTAIVIDAEGNEANRDDARDAGTFYSV